MQGKKWSKIVTEKKAEVLYNRSMARSAKPYRLISHTADLGMEVQGKDLNDLFRQAAWSFFDIMVDARRIEPNQEKAVSVEAPDREALLVAWLGELLYIFETGHLVFGKFLISSLTPQALQASAWGEKYDPRKHLFKLGIKAVTYHQVHIWEEKGEWRARVIFDL
jgi:protein archease